jgi:16S rRNA (guanine1207-N2)-methyltransferase
VTCSESTDVLSLSADPTVGRPSLTFETRDGLVSTDEIRPAERTLVELLARTATAASDGAELDNPRRRTLVVDGNYGVVPVALAATGETVTVTTTSARAGATCRANAARNDVHLDVAVVADVRDLPTEIGSTDDERSVGGRDERDAGGGDEQDVGDGDERDVGDGDPGRVFDHVVLAPYAYDPLDVVRDRLADAVEFLAADGRVTVAGTAQSGIERYADTLDELTDETERRAVVDGVRVYRGRGRSDQTSTTEADDTNADTDTETDTPTRSRYREEHEFRARVGDYECRFLTVQGLFSWESLDDGTAALVETVSVPDGARVLDCCCGYGAVGAFLGARSDVTLVGTDDDAVAVAYARRNYDRNGVTPERVVVGDCLDAVSGPFDAVVSNPPTHAGDGVTQKLFAGVREVLAPDGELWLVANRILDYDDRLREAFGFDVTVVREVDRYDVIRARP